MDCEKDVTVSLTVIRKIRKVFKASTHAGKKCQVLHWRMEAIGEYVMVVPLQESEDFYNFAEVTVIFFILIFVSKVICFICTDYFYYVNY